MAEDVDARSLRLIDTALKLAGLDVIVIPILVRIEGNHIFAALSGRECYGQTLITSVNK
jgi:hypothetical protein